MIVTRSEDITGTDRDVHASNGNWISRRYLLRKDGMGFSFHETFIKEGTETLIWYKNHLEAVFCVAGEGEVEETESGKIHKIVDGTMYALSGHERHYLRATKGDLRLICVFNPPITGKEDHDEDGVYALVEED